MLPYVAICYHMLPYVTICYHMLPYVTICEHFSRGNKNRGFHGREGNNELFTHECYGDCKF